MRTLKPFKFDQKFTIVKQIALSSRRFKDFGSDCIYANNNGGILMSYQWNTTDKFTHYSHEICLRPDGALLFRREMQIQWKESPVFNTISAIKDSDASVALR